MLDAILFEQHGVPAVAIVTHVFRTTGETMAASWGMTGYGFVDTPHPIANLTDKELDETYEYLAKLEAFLGKKIVRLRDERGFDHWLKVYRGYLPSSQMRWCTKVLKIRPFAKQ